MHGFAKRYSNSTGGERYSLGQVLCISIRLLGPDVIRGVLTVWMIGISDLTSGARRKEQWVVPELNPRSLTHQPTSSASRFNGEVDWAMHRSFGLERGIVSHQSFNRSSPAALLGKIGEVVFSFSQCDSLGDQVRTSAVARFRFCFWLANRAPLREGLGRRPTSA